jgi:hypothetical protein
VRHDEPATIRVVDPHEVVQHSSRDPARDVYEMSKARAKF